MQPLKARTLIILSIVFVILITSFIWDLYAGYIDEIDWYSNGLEYDFSARVDSTVVFHENGNGFLYCSVVAGRMNIEREDSLGSLLKKYAHLRFLRSDKNGFKIFSGSTNSFHAGDSIYINSGQVIFRICRNGEIIRDYVVRDTILKRYF